MENLEEKIKYYADNYYNGNQLISDEEYDALIKSLNKENTDIIGDDLKGVTKKIKLPIMMGTLAKYHTKEEFSKWFNEHKEIDLIVEGKCDGNSQCLVYKEGKLVQTISRGNGEYGEDTTKNVMKVQGVVKEIPGFSGQIRGEVVCKNSVFEKYFKDEANPRNTAAGRIKQKTGKDCEKLNFIAYEVFKEIGEANIDDTELHKFEFLIKSGFEVPLWWCGARLEDILEFRNDLQKYCDEVDYGMDGLVIKYMNTDKEDLKRKIPTTQIAFKPEPQLKVSTVKKIEWQLAGSYFAPVAFIEPVEIDGAIIEKASLSNVEIMNQLGVYEGANVFIKRSGMVIPQIVKVLEPKKDAFEIPTICPVCGGKVVVNESGIPVCINNLCPRKVSHRFAKMFDILGIKGAGDAFISYMEEHGITVSDFFEIIARKDEETLNRFAGNINGGKILKQMINVLSKPISTAKFLALFDYKGFDEKKLKLIGKPLDEMYNLTFDDLMKIDGFAEKTANLFLSFMHDCKEEIEDIKHYFIIEDAVVSSGKLNGLSFCFTGAACKPRKELQMLVEENGGIVKSGVSKGLNYLVSDDKDSSSSKMVKAKSLGITLISSSEFLEMICQ